MPSALRPSFAGGERIASALGLVEVAALKAEPTPIDARSKPVQLARVDQGGATMSITLSRLVLYARDVEETVRFYQLHFGFDVLRLPGDRIVELVAPRGGANLMVHPAAKGVKVGQVTVKLVFDVEDVAGFCEASARKGLVFGKVHPADGYAYANAKDPCGNNISVSSRAFREPD
jgi:predicted enzyme related to lactoylglutathione lyase